MKVFGNKDVRHAGLDYAGLAGRGNIVSDYCTEYPTFKFEWSWSARYF